MLVLRRWWLIILCTCAGLSIAYAYLQDHPSKYRASAFVRIEFVLSAKSSAASQPAMQDALNTAAVQATSDAVLLKVAPQVPGTDAQHLKAMVKATALSSSQLLQIDAVADSPTLAATVANADADALMEQQTTTAQTTNDLREQPILQEISITQDQIDTIANEIETLMTGGATKFDPRVQDANVRLTAAMKGNASAIRALLALQSDEAEHGTYLSIAQPANPASAVLALDATRVLGLGGIGGLLLGMCVAVLLRIPNRAVHTSADATRMLEAESLIALQPAASANQYTDVATGMPVERFHALWVSLATTGTGELGKVLLVTGEREDAGTSAFALDLGSQWAAEGKSIVLVNAHLGGPPTGEHVENGGSSGLAGAINRMATEPVDIEEYIVTTPTPRLWLLPAGGSWPDMNSAVSMQSLAEVVDQLRLMDYDAIILDAPPIAASNLVAHLAERADGVVVVAQGATARLHNLQRISTALRPSLTPTLALVLNKGKAKDRAHAMDRR